MQGQEDKIQFADYHPLASDFYGEVVSGLRQTPKQISPKFFYDARGSRLFDQICELPEYYPTRTEMGLLTTHRDEIGRLLGPECCLIEPGSGSSQKIRLLLDSIRPSAYMPMDISREHLLDNAAQLAEEYPWLDIHAACADFTSELILPETLETARKVAFFPGSSIGNFEPKDAQHFLQHLAETVGAGGGLLIGVDLKKPAAILNRAYNDTRGITAAFNLNLLTRINQELQGDFQLQQFEHYAFYNEALGRIEMHLRSLTPQAVTLAGERFHFAAGETIHTESSYKYSIEEFQWLAAKAGFHARQTWVDDDELFSLHYFEIPADGARGT